MDYNTLANQKIETGANGSKAITGTNAVTPATGKVFGALQCVTAAVVSARVDAPYAINADITAIGTISPGTVLFGRWTSITLSAGSMVAYYAE